MTKRGKVLRDTNAGPGLLAVDGAQYIFTLEGMWLSEVPPRTGMTVEVNFDPSGAPQTIRAVSDNQIAKEQADQALAGARRQGGAMAANLKAKFGVPTIVALAVLIVGWFLLDSLSLGDANNMVGLTFWQALGFIGKARLIPNLAFGDKDLPGSGIWGILCIVALAGPLLSYFRRERLAALGGLLPLILMLIAAYSIRSGIHDIFAQQAGHGPMAAKMIDERMSGFMENVHLATGAWVSLLASIVFAFWGLKRFLIASA